MTDPDFFAAMAVGIPPITPPQRTAASATPKTTTCATTARQSRTP